MDERLTSEALTPVPVAPHGWTGNGIACAGRYDEDGKLVETVYPDADGRINIPAGGMWYVSVGINGSMIVPKRTED